MSEHLSASPTGLRRTWARLRYWPVVLAVTAAGFGGAALLPIFGPAALAMICGVGLRTAAPARLTDLVPARLGSRVLQLSIVLLGLSVNLGTVVSVAAGSFLVMVISLSVGLGLILLIGRRLDLDLPTRALIAAGTSICGASAIAAVAPVVGASGRQISRAVAVIFAFNLTAVVMFPVIAHAIGLSASRYAVWAGTAVNDTSSVLAAAYAFGSGTVGQAATVKLARTVMIVPVVILFAAIAPHTAVERRTSPIERLRLVPRFVVAFLAGAALNTIGILPSQIAMLAPGLALLGTVVALAAIGLTVDLRSFAGSGFRLVLLGLFGWLIVAGSSLVLIELGGLA
jgi:uncharacterized integral membrane protein (TIGR00698 family)